MQALPTFPMQPLPVQALPTFPMPSVQALALLRRGNRARAVAATAANEDSSRSHALFTLVVMQARAPLMRVTAVQAKAMQAKAMQRNCCQGYVAVPEATSGRCTRMDAPNAARWMPCL